MLHRLLIFTAACACLVAAHAADWSRFRGPNGSGIATGPEPPSFFGPESNVLWSVPFPPGNSSPILFGNRLFLTAFNKSKLETICVERSSGKMLWSASAPEVKLEPAHKLSGPATPTCVTDGERVISYFGSFGLLAYDLDGRELWRVPLPLPVVEFGTGSSPIIVGDMVILLCDQDENSFLLALDKRTGKQRWRAERAEFRRGFGTPIVWRHGDAEELIVPGSVALTAYSLREGKEIWRYTGTSRVATASPVCDEKMLFNASWNIGGDAGARVVMEPFEEFAREHDRNDDGKLTREEIPAGQVRDRFGQIDLNKDGVVTPAEWQNMREMFDRAENAVIALKPGGAGEISGTHLAWKSLRSLPYCSSPLLYRGRLYTVKNGGLISCYDAASGKVVYQDERLGAGGDYYASAVAVGNKIYVPSQQGTVVVIEPADDLKVIVRNSMRSPVMATPAIADGVLYVRTTDKLFAFGK